MNLKLLLRNKGYLAFLILLPVIAVLLLNINDSNKVNDDGNQANPYIIHDLGSENELITDVVNAKLNVKVYDYCNSQLSDYILKELAGTGAYQIFRYSYQGKTADVKQVREKALNTSNHNVLGAVIYIPASFEREILSGGKSNLVVFEATKDERIKLMENSIDTYLQSLYQYASMAEGDKSSFMTIIKSSENNEFRKKIVNIEVGDNLNLTDSQQNSSKNIGYSLAFLTIGFMFSGVFIAATVIEERQNRVYNRFVLSKTSIGIYGLSKLTMVLLTALMQTGIIAIAIKILVKRSFGIPFLSYLFFVFCLGLIFNTLSLVIGVLVNNVITANYIAFIIWCYSALLAGLYFPLDAASKWWERASLLMPQRWVLKASEMLMAGKKGVYGMFILIVLSYLLLTACVGFLGIKMKRRE